MTKKIHKNYISAVFKITPKLLKNYIDIFAVFKITKKIIKKYKKIQFAPLRGAFGI